MNSNYDLLTPTAKEAETINEKIDAFNVKKLSFHGELKVFRDYIVKDKCNIVAGIRSCIYLERCLFVDLLYVEDGYRNQGLRKLFY